MTDEAAGWIEWAGGECPVAPETPVKIQLAGESTETANRYVERPAGYWARTWLRQRGGNRIIAYRVASK